MFAKGRITTTGDVFRDEKSLAFDGSNDYIAIPETTYDIDGGTVSFTFWIKILDNSVQNLVMSANPNFKNINMHSNGTMYIETNTNEDAASAPFTQDNNWHHYAITCSSGTVAMYEDGKALAMGDNTVTDDITFLRISSSTSKPFNGNISEIAIYNCTLSANQVKTIYNGREPYNHKEGVASGNLTSWYRMGDGIIDRIGKNAHTNTGAIADMSNYTLGTDVLGGKGDFSDASYWTITSGQSIVESNVGKFLGNGSYGVIQKSSVLTANKIYLAKVTCSANAGAPVHFNFGDPFPQIIPDNETGEFSICFVAGNTNVILYATTYNEAVTIDNLTIQEVGGNAGAMINMAVDDFEGDTP